MLAMVMRMNLLPSALRSENALDYSCWYQRKSRDEDAGCDNGRCEHDCTIGHVLIIKYSVSHQVHAVSREIQAERGDTEARPKLHRDIVAYGCPSRKG